MLRKHMFTGTWFVHLATFFLILIITEALPVDGLAADGIAIEKVQEKSIDDVVRQIGFGYNVDPNGDRIYSKIIWLDEKELQFLNTQEEIISSVTLEVVAPEKEGERNGKWAAFSCDGRFAAIQEYVAGLGDEMDYIKDNRYIIFNDQGQEIYTAEGVIEGNDWEDQFLISDKDGSAVKTRFIYGALDFYNPQGSVKTIPLFGEICQGCGGPGYGAFSQNGEYFSAIIQYVGNRPTPHSYDADEVWVMLFDRSGNELWRKNLGECQIDMYTPEKLAISPQGQFILGKGYTDIPVPRGEKGEKQFVGLTFKLYDKAGNEKLSLKDPALKIFRYFDFSAQEDRLIMGGENIVRVLKTSDGSMVFEKELPGDVSVRGVFFSGDGQYVIVDTKMPESTKVIEGRNTNVYAHRVFLLDLNGIQIWEQDFPDLRGISVHDMYIAFTMTHGYQVYKITEP